jgi:hypothetical protein
LNVIGVCLDNQARPTRGYRSRYSGACCDPFVNFRDAVHWGER